ncbi:MAG: mechanosensitive ion channel [Desulfobacterales bacterium]|nr:mechanosensitive ion channel [Desulfobacterales bacterium]
MPESTHPTPIYRFFFYGVVFWLLSAGWPAGLFAAEPKDAAGDKEPPSISISEDMGKAIVKEAAGVKEEIQKQARTLFLRSNLGWDLETIDYLYTWLLELPLRAPELFQQVMAQGRVLGLAGSLVVLTFVAAVLYSLMGRVRVMRRIEVVLGPVRHRIPDAVYPFFLAVLRVVVAAAIPLLLYGIYALINSLISYQAAWFVLLGRLLVLWSIAALGIGFFRELLTGGLFQVTKSNGRKIFGLVRLLLLYGAACIALFMGAESFHFRKDVLAFLQFAITVSVVCLFLLLMLNKRAILSFLPDLPYRSYQNYVAILRRFYLPLIGLSFVLALLWSFGFRQFGRVLLVNIWSTVGALLLLALSYHALRVGLERWSSKVPADDERGQFLVESAKAFLGYASAVGTAALLLNMLGLLDPIERVFSFPVLKIGQSPLSFWIIVKALLILLFFIFMSRMLQAYLDYRIYPALGVDTGPGYAINTIIRLAFFAVGLLIALNTVGVDLGFFLVFAGAIGVGIGLGLQSMAANLIAGFIIIFGGKVRKGDWIQVENGIGVVTDIHLVSTRVRTRGNLEYLIPNSTLVSNTIVNYTLSSPLVWTSLSVGVSYDSDPQQVKRILLEVAAREPMVYIGEKPSVIFGEFAESSLNFDLVVCIDVRSYAERAVKSSLYQASKSPSPSARSTCAPRAECCRRPLSPEDSASAFRSRRLV